MGKMDTVENLLDFIAKAPSAFHAVEQSALRLKEAGFIELEWGEAWKLKRGARYFVRVFGSALVAFCAGRKRRGLRIAAAHTDFPGFRVKPAAGMNCGGYGMLNVEPYGGLVLASWLDRPLSLAGQVALRGKNAFSPEVQLLDFARPLLTIPGLAIHLNRQLNDGVKLNRQTDLMPLLTLLQKEEEPDFFSRLLARELGVEKEELLSYDLTVYPYEAGCRFGAGQEFVSAPRLDNLTSVKACLDGFINSDGSGVRMIVLFDNEEVGSRTKQGAGSALLRQVAEAVYRGLGRSSDELQADIAAGFLLSCDVAHGLHPDYLGKADPTNRPKLNGGVVLKRAASQAYAGDAAAVAVVEALCRDNNISHQHFVNRSDIPGGSTLGSIASAEMAMRAMDVGVPILSMHSARETMGADDQQALTGLLAAFFA